jgi:hypothetical protein
MRRQACLVALRRMLRRFFVRLGETGGWYF